jgi:hypothetical protein
MEFHKLFERRHRFHQALSQFRSLPISPLNCEEIYSLSTRTRTRSVIYCLNPKLKELFHMYFVTDGLTLMSR